MRTCGDCQQWQYDDAKRVGGPRIKRGGKSVPRVKGERPPCARCPKIPPGKPPFPHHAVELSDKNRQAIAAFWEWRATGEIPDDPIARRNAGLLTAALDEIADSRQRSLVELGSSVASLLTTLVSRIAVRG